MKKVLGVFLLFPLLGYAQLEKSNSLVTGTVQWSSGITPNPGPTFTKARLFNVRASYGYLLTDVWMVGVATSSYYGKTTTNDYLYTYTSQDADVYARRYVRLFDKCFLQVDGAIGLYFYRTKTHNATLPVDATAEKNGQFVSITPGVTYFIHPRVALTGELGSFRLNHDTLAGLRFWSGTAALGISQFSLGASVKLGN